MLFLAHILNWESKNPNNEWGKTWDPLFGILLGNFKGISQLDPITSLYYMIAHKKP